MNTPSPDSREKGEAVPGNDAIPGTGSSTPRRTDAPDILVTIPATEYAALLECRRIATESRFRATRFMKPLRSSIERDIEVAVFLAERFGNATLAELLDECRSRFGPSRTPSRSSAHRYWTRLRVAASSRKGHSGP